MALKMAPCGIDCNNCDLYRAAFDEKYAASLIPWFKSRGWLKQEDGVAEVMAKAPYCVGCCGDRSVQWSEDCAIRSCCWDEKGLDHCGECGDFVCGILASWALEGGHHAVALERLKSLTNRTIR